MDVNRHFEAFGLPFPASDVSWKLQITSKDKQSGKVVPYLDARAISDRLDEVVGQYNWKDDYGQWHCYTEEPKDEGKKPKKVNSQLCTISIYDEERHQWISKTDGAENTDIEPIKGGLSDSFKRCAVKWNIGRYLYNFEPVWVNLVEEYGRRVIEKTEYQRLEKIYYSTVEKLFGKEIADKLRPQNNGQGNQKQQGAPQQSKPAPQPQTAPQQGNPAPQQQPTQQQGTPEKRPDIYEIKSVRCEGSGETVKSTLVLNKGGKENTMFMYGQDPNLKMGTKLMNLRGHQQKNAYGTYLILEGYDIAA